MTIEGYQTGDSAILASLATRVNRSTSEQASLSHSGKVPLDPATYIPHLSQRFEILERARIDSTGIVYKVYDGDFNRIAALKVLPYFSISQSVEARIVRDLKAMLNLHHQSILEVFDFGKTYDGAPYMVTEYFDGEDLASILDRLQLLTPVRAEIIFLQLTDALAHAHRQGVIHRDIKPSNVLVMLDTDGNQTIKLMDFGISKTVAENIPDHLRFGDVEVRGSTFYSSPEQIRGNVFDSRSDLYSLGCLMYEVLAGRSAINDGEQLNKEPVRLRRKNSRSDIPERLEYCISRCLEKEASARFKDADALSYHLTSSIAQGERPQMRRPFPWLRVIKVLALMATAYLPFFVSKTFAMPLWVCLTIYGLALVLLILYAVQNQELSYRLRSRSTIEPRDSQNKQCESTF